MEGQPALTENGYSVESIEKTLRQDGFSEEEIIKLWLIDDGRILTELLEHGNVDQIKQELKTYEI
jgi:hypothetical protein